MTTKEEIQDRALTYVSQCGYVSGSNYTTSAVASLAAGFADQETAELRAENEQLRADNAILLKWQTSGGKCQCTESTGWTTVKCCNHCGLPVPGEPWSMPEMERLRAELERVKKGEWISVKDRLPGQQVDVMSMDVLVFTGHGIDVSCYDFELKRWCGSPFMIVTHWMPLPEPPKE